MNFSMVYKKYFSWFMARMALVVALTTVVSSCDSDEPEVPAGPEDPTTGRTVLVYMLSASNGLGATPPYDYDMQDIREMCDAAAAGDITDGRLLVFHSASNGNQVLKEITGTGEVDTLKIYDPEIRPQTSQRMSEVLDDMKTLAPADDYGMILWGHGTGWLEDGIADEARSEYQTYAYGSEQGDKWKMNITTLASVLEDRDFSFVYFDCCYMASVEVVYQMRHVAPRIVAYPTEVLAWGMPYDRNVKHFFAKEPELVEAATETYDFYASQYNPTYRMCTVSVFNTAGMERLAAATREIYRSNTTGVPANYTPQSYTLNRNNYYCDFGGYINALKPDSRELDEFKAALADVVELELVTEKIWNQLAIREHSGFSTFIMSSDADMSKLNYSRLDWFGDVASALIQ